MRVTHETFNNRDPIVAGCMVLRYVLVMDEWWHNHAVFVDSEDVCG